LAGSVASFTFRFEAETVEVLGDVLSGGVAVVQSAMRREVGLDQSLEAGPHLRRNDLRGFRLQVAGKPLEVGAEQDHVAAQVLVRQPEIRRGERQRRGALRVQFRQAGHPAGLPAQHKEADGMAIPQTIALLQKTISDSTKDWGELQD
jgi:hypothetical protein